MKLTRELLVNIMLWALVLFTWIWTFNQALSYALNLSIIVGAMILIYPVVWIGRKALDRQPTTSRAVWVTMFIHYAVGGLFGVAIIRAVTTYQDWSGWMLPIPTGVGLILVLVTGLAGLLTIANLALKGLGAPFAIALSKKLAMDWLYAWTRNPMVLSGLALLTSLGIWFQSALFGFGQSSCSRQHCFSS